MSDEIEVHLPATPAAENPAFLFDFTSPDSYLAAERILALMPVPVEWIPVRGAKLPEGPPTGMSAAARDEIEARGAERMLQRFVWPDPFPFDDDLALRAATYAKASGRVVAFSLAALRQCYAAGRSLADIDNVVIAASGCEMHPAAVIKGVELRSTATALTRATELALARGVRSLPAVYVPDADSGAGEVHHGDAQLEAATRALAERAA